MPTRNASFSLFAVFLLAPAVLGGQISSHSTPFRHSIPPPSSTSTSHTSELTEIGSKLPSLYRWFVNSRKAITTVSSEQGLANPSTQVSELLQGTELRLLKILKDDWFAATRDAAEEVFLEARAKLTAPQHAALLDHPNAEGFRAAILREPWRPAEVARAAQSKSGATVLKEIADASLDLVQHFLEQLTDLAKTNTFEVNLCIASMPASGARFSMHPRSYPAGMREVQATNDTIPSVARGLYTYRIQPASGESHSKSVQCGWEVGEESRDCLNLLKDTRTTLVCDLAQGFCRLSDAKCP
jgi:hypothetical protein